MALLRRVLRGRRRHRLRDEGGEPELQRGAAHAGRAGRRAAAVAAATGADGPAPPRQRGGDALLPTAIAVAGRGGGAGLPAGPRCRGGDGGGLRAGPEPRRPRRAEGPPRGPGVYGGAAAARGTRFAAPAGRLTRPLPRAAHVPHPRRRGPSRGLWRTLAGREPAQVPEHAADDHLRQVVAAVGAGRRPGQHQAARRGRRRRGVHGRAHGAPARLHQRGGIYGHGADVAAGDRAAGTGGQLRAGAGPGRRGPGSHHAEPQDLMAGRPRRARSRCCRRARTRTSSSGRPRSAGPKSSRPPSRASTSASGSWRRGSTWTSPTAAAP